MIEGIEIIKNEKDTLEIEIKGAQEGFGELLSKYLNEEKDVEFAAYKKEHPFDTSIKLVIKSKKNPKKILLSVIKKTRTQIEEMDSLLKKV